MTNQEMNVAIGLALGLEIERKTRRGNPCPNGVEYWYLLEHHGGVQTWRKLPNYCTDLNAIHEAEKTLTDDQFKLYSHWVEKLMPNTGFRFLLCATASQRAEAFVRSLGKWATDKDSLTVQPTTEDSSVVGKEAQQ